ncbi:uncharacterized protein LOC103493872 isoform X3 [Cucumis melo]|uniref:Uncharacterized protein LOC103493872 isoform X3 n=1 Tax=Cucumis melo TaxID=3656 RepID=A0A1S3BUQ4_CUCME|nr:uncharacterized protein LOC103493872 isoform X3 [Cucumis melo]
MGNEAGWSWWRFFIVAGVAVTGFLFPSSSASQQEQLMETQPVVSRIAFGSCANQDAPQPIWNSIINFDPHVFIWLGDNIYGDIRRPFKLFGRERTVGPWKNVPRFIPSSKQEMMLKYNKGKTIPGYSWLRQRTKVIGVWDDHDYGLNDAGKEFTEKVTNQKLLLDFLDEPLDSPRRKQHGVYASYMFGPIGKQIKRKGVFFISGDVHFGEISRSDCAVEYPLFDITSSGLTQAVERAVPRPLQFLVRFLAWLTPSTMRVMKSKCRYNSCTFGMHANRLIFSLDVLHCFASLLCTNCRFLLGQPNFGVVEIDWGASPVRIKMEVRDTNGLTVVGVNIPLSSLRPGNNEYLCSNGMGEYQRHCLLEVHLGWIVRYRLAILFYSTLTLLLLASLGIGYVATLTCRKCIRKCKRD